MLEFITTYIRKLYEACEYLIAPPVCYACRLYMYEYSILCRSCDEKVVPIAPKIFKINSKYMMSVHAIARYDDPLKKLILAKHRSDSIIIEGLADLMWQKTVISLLEVDCFVPIPLHWTRKWKRGFNQAELLAKKLAVFKKVEVCNVLQRVKKTEYQARLDQENRAQNVKKAFTIKEGSQGMEGRHVILVDDLCTTGSTAIEAAKVIAKLQPASISLVVACRSK